MSYFWRWLRTAFTHSIGLVDLVSGFAGAAVALVTHFAPAWAPTVSALSWQIPIWAALAVIVVRLVLAPYWMHQEDAVKMGQLEDLRLTQDRRRAIRNRLGEFMDRGRELADLAAKQDLPPPETEGNKWLQDLTQFLDNTDGLGPAYVARLNNSNGLPVMHSSIISEPHRKISLGLRFRLARLEQFLQEMAN